MNGETRVYVTDFCSGAPWEESNVNRALCAADTAFATRFETRERNRCDNAGNQNVIVPHCHPVLTDSSSFLFRIGQNSDKHACQGLLGEFYRFYLFFTSSSGCIREKKLDFANLFFKVEVIFIIYQFYQ